LKDHEFLGYHSEWNLGSPGGWDYQRITQEIGKAVWEKISARFAFDLKLDFDHPMLNPVNGFVEMLIQCHHRRSGSNRGLIAVVAEEETLEDVVENQNLAKRLSGIDGITGTLMAPQEVELSNGKVCFKGEPISTIFMDFNSDVLLHLHRKHGLDALLQAVRENRVVNPRGTEPINVKSMFELITDPEQNKPFADETIRRTPWTRRFYGRRTMGPKREIIDDLVEWTRENWQDLVLKPERGYSGKGVRVGGVHKDADDAVSLALKTGNYIVQEKVPLYLWAEEMPQLDETTQKPLTLEYQTDFRCLFGKDGLYGFLGRWGHVPTNVGSGGGVQPLALLYGDISVGEATARINEAIVRLEPDLVAEAVDLQKEMALAERFTYLLGPIKIALRPRLLKPAQMKSLEAYCANIWQDCLTLEKMWLAGKLDHMISIEPEELAIAKSQPWAGSPALFAADGIFSFGAHKEP
jgi:hypothetical protein